MGLAIRKLDARDAAAYQRLRLRALEECPAAFSASHADESARTMDEVATRLVPSLDGAFCMFGAFDAAAVVGFVAFIRPLRPKLAHGAQVAGMYVAPECRRHGAGHLLMAALIAHARALDLRNLKLSLNVGNVPARRLYESAGFTQFGVEPGALCIDGAYFDEAHMVLRLR